MHVSFNAQSTLDSVVFLKFKRQRALSVVWMRVSASVRDSFIDPSYEA